MSIAVLDVTRARRTVKDDGKTLLALRKSSSASSNRVVTKTPENAAQAPDAGIMRIGVRQRSPERRYFDFSYKRK